jgi:hypothetical protein
MRPTKATPASTVGEQLAMASTRRSYAVCRRCGQPEQLRSSIPGKPRDPRSSSARWPRVALVQQTRCRVSRNKDSSGEMPRVRAPRWRSCPVTRPIICLTRALPLRRLRLPAELLLGNDLLGNDVRGVLRPALGNSDGSHVCDDAAIARRRERRSRRAPRAWCGVSPAAG